MRRIEARAGLAGVRIEAQSEELRGESAEVYSSINEGIRLVFAG